MSKLLPALSALTLCCGCLSIQTTALKADDLYADPGGEPTDLIQVNTVGLSLFLQFVNVVDSNLEGAMAELTNEAKGLGATKVKLLSAHTSPRGGVYALICLIACFPNTEVVGIAVREK